MREIHVLKSLKQPLVSVLIATRDRPQTLLKCLVSVFDQDYPNFEVLVLDDNSETHDICEILSEELGGKKVKCFRSNKRIGVAGARNFLMKKSKGEIFLFIDDDAVFSSNDCISRTVRHFRGDTGVGIIAFKIINHTGEREKLLVPFSQYCRFKHPDVIENKQTVSYYLGGGHAINRKVIEQCGLYQDNFGFGGEELDLSYRVVQAGMKILYAPDIVVHHYPGSSLFGVRDRGDYSELYFRVRNRIWLAYKYIPFPYLPVYLFLWFMSYGATALKIFDVRNLFLGIRDGVRELRPLKRTPLDQNALKYLRANFGRLWY